MEEKEANWLGSDIRQKSLRMNLDLLTGIDWFVAVKDLKPWLAIDKWQLRPFLLYCRGSTAPWQQK